VTYGNTDVVVVGAGVSGLTTALLLRRAGVPVRLLARDFSVDTTSCNAGAIWGPHLVGHPRVADWSEVSLRMLTELAADPDRTGVRLVSGVEASRLPVEPPEWMRALDSFTPVPAAQLPAGFAVGWRYRVPIIDMPVYLAYLVAELEALQVVVQQHDIADFAELTNLGRVVVNCTGLGSHDLVKDDELTPVRGDLVLVANPGIDEFFAEHIEEPDNQTYILPQGKFLLLGGTAFVEGRPVPPAAQIVAGIIERCAEVDDRLTGAEMIEHRVGERPSRAMIRLEPEKDAVTSYVVHNYGHGGGGVTLSWGCAEDVVALVQLQLRRLAVAQTAPANA
jgi:D-amino-acid oxidase